MGATTRDIFGQAGTADPATPGSYGQPPRGFRLPDATRLGPVRLQVADLTRSLTFYQHVLLLELRERPGARPAPRRGSLGLYHFAILLPDRSSLGRFVRHLGDIGVPAGSADHLVSES